MRCTRNLYFVMAVALSIQQASADIGPPPPRPPPPAGPSEAVVRGVTVVQGYGYWRGRRWMTYIKSCAPSQASCGHPMLKEGRACIITGIDGRTIAGGDIAGLINELNAAAGRPILLQLDACGDLIQLELLP